MTRLFVIFIGLSFFLPSLHAQEGTMSESKRQELLAKSDSLFAHGVELYEAERYNEAIHVFEEYNELKTVWGTDKSKQANLKYYLASCYHDLGDNDKALELGEQAKEMWSEVYGVEHPDYAKALTKLGQIKRSLTLYNESVELCSSAIEIYGETVGKSHPDYAEALSSLSITKFFLGELDEAIALGEEALSIYETIHGQEHKDYAEALINLGTFYGINGDLKGGIKLLTEGLQIIERTIGSACGSYVNCLAWLMSFHKELGDLDQALEYGKKALSISKATDDIIEGKYLLYDISEIYFLQEDYQAAIEYASEGIGQDESRMGAECSLVAALAHIKLGHCGQAEPLLERYFSFVENSYREFSDEYQNALINVSDQLVETQCLTQVIRWRTEALDILKQTVGEGNNAYAESLVIVGICKVRTQDIDGGREDLNRALVIMDSLPDTDPSVVASAKLMLASCYTISGNWSYVEQLISEAMALIDEDNPLYAPCQHLLQICKQVNGNTENADQYAQELKNMVMARYGERSLEYAKLLHSLVLIELSNQNYDDAMEHIEQALTIVDKISGTCCKDYALMLNTKATLCWVMGEHFDAWSCQMSAVTIYETLGLTDEMEYVILAQSFAKYCAGTMSYREAVQYEELVVSFYKTNGGENSTQYAQALNTLALNYSKALNVDETFKEKALSTGTQVVEVFEKVYGKRSADYATALNNLATYYSALGQHEEAARLNKKALAIYNDANGKETVNYITTLRNQADNSKEQGNPRQAIQQITKAIELGERVYGKETDEYANMLSSLASYHADMENYTEAIRSEKEANVIFEKLHGKDKVFFATSTRLLAGYYSENGDFEEALRLYLLELPLRRELLGTNSNYYAQGLSSVADCYWNLEDTPNAIEYETQAMQIFKETDGENGGSYIESLNNLAQYYDDIDNYVEAIRLAEIVMLQRKEVYGEKHYMYAAALHRLAGYYSDAFDHDKAIKLENQALEIIALCWGKNHPAYAEMLNKLAIYYSNTGQLSQAIQIEEEACSIWKKHYGKNDPDYATSLHNLAQFYNDLGFTSKAIKLANEALQIKKDIYGEREYRYADTKGNLSIYYSNNGDLEQALKYGLEALRIREATYGRIHEDYALALNNIAGIYSDMGKIAEAVRAAEEALSIYRETLEENHPSIATTLSNLSSYYSQIGNETLAEQMEKQALEIRKERLGTNSADYANSLQGLAVSLSSQGKYEQALENYTQALDIYKSLYGQNHNAVALVLNNMAKLYFSLENYDKALQLANNAYDINKKLYGENHPNLVSILRCLSDISSRKAAYEDAVRYDEEALRIQTACYGADCAENASLWEELSWRYLLVADTLKLQKSITQATNLNISTVMNTFAYLTAYERQLYWDNASVWFERNVNWLSSLHPSSETISNAYNCALLSKGLLLNSEIAFSQFIQESNDSAIVALYNELKWLKNDINKHREKTFEERYADVDSLSEIASQMEKELLAKSKIYGDYTSNLVISWPQVRDKLGERDAAIEFVSFPSLNNTTVYNAYVLRKGYDNPRLIHLFEESQLDSINKANYYVTDSIARLVWQPLQEVLSNAETVYFSPSGELYNIAIESVPSWEDGGRSIVSDKRNYCRLSSTRELALIKDENRWDEAAVYGGLQYGMSVSSMVDDDKQYPKQRGDADLCFYVTSGDEASRDDRDINQGLPYLKGTKVEAMAVKKCMDADRVPAQLFTDSIGTEASFKALSGKKTSIIHIGTHGFFNKIKKEYNEAELQSSSIGTQKKMIEDAALTNSGLYFAGADNAINDKSVIPNGIDDGKLTALEIAQLDLRGLDLVVLSACQTGLGEITGDGVFGLQRGFKKAGAQTIVMSLWKVDDDATTEFMTRFFQNIKIDNEGHTTDKQQAFREAQNHIRTVDNGKYKDPKYWAAFVMLNGIDM